MILTVLRPLGLLFGFVVMRWAFGRAWVLRISIGLALALPVLAGNITEVEELIVEGNIRSLVFIAPKEFGIGYGLGFLSSLPLVALQFSGAITDAFRGETDSGLTSPTGEPLTTFGALYIVIGFAAFAAFGGLLIMVESLYRSYAIWHLGNTFPTLDEDAAMLAAQMLGTVLRLAIQIAAPLLIFLAAIEFVISISARLARRFNLYDHSFSLKNLGGILSLPLLALFVWMLAEELSDDIGGSLTVMESLFK